MINKINSRSTENSCNPLIEEITAKIRRAGKITFKEYMEHVLYHPEYGYYMSRSERFSKGGDFITSPEIHPFFGKAVAVQLIEMIELLGTRDDVVIIELGGGSGRLAGYVLSSIEKFAPQVFERISYKIIEKNTFFKMRKVKGALIKDKITWCKSFKDAIADNDAAIILSNEFFDALPFHRVKKENGNLYETFVGYDEGFCDCTAPLSTDKLKDHIAAFGLDILEGMECEINLCAIEWIKKVASNLKKGFLLTIDYGYPSKELYSQRHSRGTMLCHYRHKVVNDPYKNIGSQDITSHVDFTSLCLEGEKNGLDLLGYTDQGSFLISLGVLQEFDSINEADVGGRSALKTLFMPGGFGDTFKVLIQSKGMGRPELKGLSWKNRKDRLFL